MSPPPPPAAPPTQAGVVAAPQPAVYHIGTAPQLPQTLQSVVQAPQPQRVVQAAAPQVPPQQPPDKSVEIVGEVPPGKLQRKKVDSVMSSGRFGQAPGGKPMHNAPDEHEKKGIKRLDMCLPFLKGFVGLHIPWVIFAVVGLTFIFFYHASHFVVLFCILCLAFGLAASAMSIDRKRHVILFVMMWLCLLAVGMGTLAGLYNYQTNIHFYWHAYEGQEYTNMPPDELAGSHQDAGVIYFSYDAYVDVTRPTSFRSRDSDFCVAPILSKSVTGVTVQHWAIGKDCCDSIAGFRCDDSRDPYARVGLVAPNSSFLLVKDSLRFHDAVEMAKTSYGFTVPKDILLIRWVRDVDEGLASFWYDALRTWLWEVFWGYLALFLACMFALIIMMGPTICAGVEHAGSASEAQNLWDHKEHLHHLVENAADNYGSVQGDLEDDDEAQGDAWRGTMFGSHKVFGKHGRPDEALSSAAPRKLSETRFAASSADLQFAGARPVGTS